MKKSHRHLWRLLGITPTKDLKDVKAYDQQCKICSKRRTKKRFGEL